MAHEENTPEKRKQAEANHDTEHAGRIEVTSQGKVGVDRERCAIEENEQNRATKPGHLRVKIANRFFAMFGRQPISFVGEIDAFGRLIGEDAGSDEGDESGESDDQEHESEEGLLGLIAVGSAIGGEMRGHNVRKLRVNMCPLQQAQSKHNQEDELGKARIVHEAGPLTRE